VEHALALLRQIYASCRARQLFHNRSEVTILLAEPYRAR
jgi:23S rRNA C2498 (ribose-2'-O)-methylase RlmM